MPKYLVSLTNTEIMEGEPDPNLNYCEVIVANNRRDAIKHAAGVWAQTYNDGENAYAIVEGYDYTLMEPDHQLFKHDEWHGLNFCDADDGHIINGYVVRITRGCVEAVDVTV